MPVVTAIADCWLAPLPLTPRLACSAARRRIGRGLPDRGGRRRDDVERRHLCVWQIAAGLGADKGYRRLQRGVRLDAEREDAGAAGRLVEGRVDRNAAGDEQALGRLVGRRDVRIEIRAVSRQKAGARKGSETARRARRSERGGAHRKRECDRSEAAEIPAKAAGRCGGEGQRAVAVRDVAIGGGRRLRGKSVRGALAVGVFQPPGHRDRRRWYGRCGGVGGVGGVGGAGGGWLLLLACRCWGRRPVGPTAWCRTCVVFATLQVDGWLAQVITWPVFCAPLTLFSGLLFWLPVKPPPPLLPVLALLKLLPLFCCDCAMLCEILPETVWPMPLLTTAVSVGGIGAPPLAPGCPLSCCRYCASCPSGCGAGVVGELPGVTLD